MDAFYLWFSAMDNDLLRAYGNYTPDKIEEGITFNLIHARLYLFESDDEQDNKSSAAKKLVISCGCGGGGSSSSLSAINVSVSATSGVVSCWIFTSDLFLPNDPLSSDDMVDWDNHLMLGIGGGDTNIDEGSLVLHNSW